MPLCYFLLMPSAPRIVLASASPRRQQLLSELGVSFQVDPAHVDEDALTVPDPVETAESLARTKALSVAARHPGALVIGGDTVVALDEIQLSKPADFEDAVRMLLLLQGRSHRVITGISLQGPGLDQTFHDVTRVFFRPVSEEEIRAYVATGEPMDKAGSYGAQGMAATFVDRLEGSLSNVVGLPQEKLGPELARAIERLSA